MGGVELKPLRLFAVEQLLQGKVASQPLFQEAATVAMQGAKTFEHNAYKIKLGKAAIVEALTKAIG